MPSSGARILAASDHSVLVVFADEPGIEHHRDLLRLTTALLAHAAPFVRNVHPGHASLLVSFDPSMRSSAAMQAWIEERLQELSDVEIPTPHTIEIPVCYGGDFGPDLDAVAALHGLSADEVVTIHSRALYRVEFLGFSPGFPYLAGLPPRLATPRLAVPRTHVPAGSVAIGGTHTGVYPLASPGGWRLIGRTPLRLFRSEAMPPAGLQMGDQIRFRRIEPAEFATLAVPDPGAAFEPSRNRAPTAQPRGEPSLSADAPGGLTVEKPGFMASIQDLGRFRAAHLGVSASGAADSLALGLGNWLLGNTEDAAAIELTLVGGSFVFHDETVIALTGSDFGAMLEEPRASGGSRSIPVLPWRVVRVAPGSRLVLGHARDGARGYLCVGGGLAIPPFLGSTSTHLQSGLGGLGRALAAGDRLRLVPRGKGTKGPPRQADSLDMQWIAQQYAPGPLRITVGPQVDWFSPDSQARLAEAEYEVLEQSNRMGIRLAGPILARARSGELQSEGVSLGAIQVPESGQPILLFVEHQTTGGYPKIANVCSADMHRVGQLRPRDRLRFQWVTLNAARALVLERDAWLARRREGGGS